MINATKKFSVIFALFLWFFLIEAKADLSCPESIASDTGNADMRGLDVRNGTCGVYNLNITSYNSAGSGGFAIASFPFTALLPDTNFPSSARFVMHNGISEVSFSTVTCNGATISSLGTTHVDITLASGTSCELTLAGDSDTIGYVGATLSRSASSLYSLTVGTLIGGSFGGTFTPAPSTPTVNLSVSSNSGTEAGTTAITVTATASAAVSGAQTVTVGASGTNITASDYTLSSTTITIADGQTTGTVTFTIVDDSSVEGAETATLTISNPSSGISLGSTTTQDVGITDDDYTPDSTLTAGSTVTEPVNLPSTADTSAEAVNLFDFKITDGGGGDGLSTDVSQIVLHTSGTGDFSKVTWRLNGNDATNIVGTYNAGAKTLTFSGLSISVADGANETYTLSGYYSTATGLINKQSYGLSLDGDDDLTVSGTQMNGSNSAVDNGTGTLVDIMATKLIFETLPSNSN